MKRRNIDSAKMRRTLKKNRMSESFCSGSLIYLKILFVWAFVMMADFLLDFRFEYFWPSWLLLRSIYDSFRYQGVAFSVFFVCVTVTSDLVFFIFIPFQWLFFLASTYVWVQYVWHADRGVCLPTVTLWLLFVYVEASVRLKELKMLPFTLDLCRPFAAHCIGYPVVTLGFGVKSYISYRLRLRKQKEVALENEVYLQILNEALPAEYNRVDGEKHKYVTSRSTTEEIISNGAVCCSSSNNNTSIFSNYNNSHNPTSSYNAGGGSNMVNSSTTATSSTSSSRYTKNLSTASSNLPKQQNRKISNGWTPQQSQNGHHMTTNGFYNNNDDVDEYENADVVDGDIGAGRAPGDEYYDDDDNENDLDYVSTNSSTIIGRLSALVSKLFGLNVDDDDDGDDEVANEEKFGGKNYNSNSNWSSQQQQHQSTTTTTTTVDYCRDSDDESRASKDSRDSSNVVIVSTSMSNDLQTKKSSQPTMNGGYVGGKTTTKLRRRGGSSPQFTNSCVNNLNVTNASSPSLSSITSSSSQPQQQQLSTKDVNTAPHAFGQKEKVQDKDLCLSLESDIEKLKNELRLSRTREQDLRRQINDLITSDKSVKNELQQQKQLNEQLQTKLQNLVRARQQDKQTVATLEKRVCEEQKLKTQLEQSLQQEKKQQQKKLEEANKLSSSNASNKTDCTEACKARRREIECQIKQVRRDLQQRDEQFVQMEAEIRTLRQYKETNNVDVLMSALNAMKDKNQHLETSLSDETRIKLDLFSALGNAKRQLEITHNQLTKKEQELDELRHQLNHVAGNQLLFNLPLGINSPLTPPPSVPPSASNTLDGSSFDLMSPSMYPTPNYLSSMMFEDCPPIFSSVDYNNLQHFVPIVNNQHPSTNVAAVDQNPLRFTPPRSSNNSH